MEFPGQSGPAGTMRDSRTIAAVSPMETRNAAGRLQCRQSPWWQLSQRVTRFPGSFPPPRPRGKTWWTVKSPGSLLLHLWQRYWSRARAIFRAALHLSSGAARMPDRTLRAGSCSKKRAKQPL
jgi:hypothetical protein